MTISYLRPLIRAAAAVFALWLFFAYGAPLCLPFLLAAAINGLSLPLRRRLSRRLPPKLSAVLSVTVILAAAGICGGLFAASLLRTARELLQTASRELPSLAAAVADLETRLLRWADALPAPLSEPALRAVDGFFRSGASLWERTVNAVVSTAGGIPAAVSDVLLFAASFFLSVYGFALRGGAILRRIQELLPPDRRAQLTRCLHAMGGWFRAQGIIMLLTFGLVLIGFSLLRMRRAALFAVLATLIDIVPVCGIGLFFFPWILLLLLTGQPVRAALAAVLYLLSETMHVLLQPKLMGDRMELPPLAALAAFYVGYRAGGFWGMLLLPTLASVLAAALG